MSLAVATMQSNYFEIYICRNSVCSVANSLDSFQSCHCLFDSFLLNGRTLQQTTNHVSTCQLPRVDTTNLSKTGCRPRNWKKSVSSLEQHYFGRIAHIKSLDRNKGWMHLNNEVTISSMHHCLPHSLRLLTYCPFRKNNFPPKKYFLSFPQIFLG